MILLAFFFFFAEAPPPAAADIMAKVAANQDRAESMRTAFVYRQNMLLRVNRANGKLSYEEDTDYTVTPTPKGFQRERTRFLGKYVEHGKIVEFHEPGHRSEMIHVDFDGESGSVSDQLAGDSTTKDGIGRDMFPLTGKEQAHYAFKLEGQQDYRGRPVYVISFEPKKGDGESCWAGEALIDRNEFQPVMVSTHLAFNIPVVVRTVLGTNIQNLGFKVTYDKFDEGLWFPVTYGGEMKVRVLFFYARRIGISMRNSDFRRASVNSQVSFDKPAESKR